MPKTPSQGEIVLIPVPFTDLSSQKRRPVIITSNNLYNRSARDMLVVAMTSNLSTIPYSFVIDNPDLSHWNPQSCQPGTLR
jgi:mRNA interferase MazF